MIFYFSFHSFLEGEWGWWLTFWLVTYNSNSDLTKTLLNLITLELPKLTSICMLVQKLTLGRITTFMVSRWYLF